MARGHALALLLGLGLGLGACHKADLAAPLSGHQELCCKDARADNRSFVGCRATGYCRTTEDVWVRGPVSCGAVDEAQCAGGRCCELVVEPMASAEAPEPAAKNDDPGEVPVAEPPAPIAVTPVPIDWQARPTPVSVPKFVCTGADDRAVAGIVVLEVEVDAGGRVRAVAIRRSLAPGCDALARDALLHAEFEPALSPGGDPIPATISWSYRFEGEAPR